MRAQDHSPDADLRVHGYFQQVFQKGPALIGQQCFG